MWLVLPQSVQVYIRSMIVAVALNRGFAHDVIYWLHSVVSHVGVQVHSTQVCKTVASKNCSEAQLVNFCAVYGCGNRVGRDKKSFFCIPAIVSNQDERTLQLSKSCHDKWLS